MDKEANTTVFTTDFTDLVLTKRGKVRDVYELDPRHLVIVATDRISCFDSVLPTPIPRKGRVLNQISCWWFDFFSHQIASHFVSSDISGFKSLAKYTETLSGRCMIVRKAEPLPIECVVRGYLAGSGWKEYLKQQTICGISLPSGLHEASSLPEPIFTPSTKAHQGHDENISFEDASRIVGASTARRIRELSIQLYTEANAYACQRGIIIADTKFEFGTLDGEIVLIDEILTPDSSRFWPQKEYRPGGPQLSFDKQFVRDYLESICWNKTPPAPELPLDVVTQTEEKYRQALKLLTGRDLA